MHFFLRIFGILHVCTVYGFMHQESSTVTVFQGKRFELPCQVTYTENNVKYIWKLNGSYVPVSSRRYFENGNLIIERIDRFQDTGEYICEIRNTHEKSLMIADPIFVRVHWIDENVSVGLIFPKLMSALHHGSNVTLRCFAIGSGSLKISWSKNGERISNGDRISLENDLLLINHATSRENGVYRCSASNDAGDAASLINFVLKLPSEPCASLMQISHDQIAKEGDDVRLNCVYENYDLLEWYFKENGPLKNTSRFVLSSGGSSLLIKSVDIKDEGMYSCVGVKKECETYPSKYTVIVWIADFEHTNTSMLEPDNIMEHVVAEGKNFSIACLPPVGYPTPTISWKIKFNEIINDADDRVKTNGPNLTINYARKNDSGRYVCRAENIAGFVESWFNLTVSVIPVVVQHPHSQTISEGSSVSFICKYEGTPQPFTKISWLKNEASLVMNTSAVSLNGTQGTLQLFNVESSDAGNYVCVVDTRFFQPVKSHVATLAVIQKLKFNPLPVAKKMELGLANKIPCKAEGTDPPVIKWKKETSAGHSVSFPKHVQDLNGTLYFSTVRSDDRGRYVCIASNSQGVINVTIDADVVVTPKFVVLPKNPSDGYEGHVIRLDCAAEGDPSPTIQWDNNFVDISQKRFTKLPNGSLQIDELHLSDAGIYGCTAGNSGGFNRTEVLLTVRTSDGFKMDGSGDNIESDTVGRTIVITLGAAFAYILLVVVLMAWCRYRRRRKKRSFADAQVDIVPLDDEETKRLQRNTSELKETETRHLRNGNVQNAKCENDHFKYVIENYANLNFSRTNLHDIMLLGNGELGNVYLARNKCNNDAVVMVKVVEEIRPELIRQLDILKHVQHEHIVKLIGVCWDTEPLYMTLEYTDWGDLKQFLIATRKSSVRVVGNKQRPPPLTLQQSLSIVQQAASALEYITHTHYTHKDVAARNCLITSSLQIKITFSSLCKDTYGTEYFEIRNQFVPLRWLPLEAVINDEFSAKTDVYSYACLVWEIFTKGELPFFKLSNEEVLNLLEKRQLRWKLPKSLPTTLAKLLNKCWSTDAMERPSFSDITKELADVTNLVNQM